LKLVLLALRATPQEAHHDPQCRVLSSQWPTQRLPIANNRIKTECPSLHCGFQSFFSLLLQRPELVVRFPSPALLRSELRGFNKTGISWAVQCCYTVWPTWSTNRPVKEDIMAKPLLPDALWERIKPLLPPERPKPKGGRPRVPDRASLTGILFVLKTGCPWEYLPKELGCGSGMTCWRRLRDWHAAGVWKKIWRLLLDELGAADRIDWSTSAIDSCSVRAVFGGQKRARIPRIAARMARSVI